MYDKRLNDDRTAEPSDDMLRLPASDVRGHGWFFAIEVYLGVIVLCLAVIGVVGFVGLATWTREVFRHVPRWPLAARVGVPILWVVLLVAGARSIAALGGGASKPTTLPLAGWLASNRHTSESRVVRLMAAAWWTFLAFALLWMSAAFATQLNDDGRNAFHATATDWAVHFTIHVGACVAMNLCLLIGLFHLTRSESLVHRVASLRLLLDLFIIAALIYVEPFVRPFDL